MKKVRETRQLKRRQAEMSSGPEDLQYSKLSKAETILFGEKKQLEEKSG